MRILGLDPGLQCTGWAILLKQAKEVRYETSGHIRSTASMPIGERLAQLYQALSNVCTHWVPTTAAVEKIFVNKNPASALKLGLARGVVLMTPAQQGVPVSEYSANTIKKMVTGHGHAGKTQVLRMVCHLLNLETIPKPYDASDALAVALCHSFCM